MGFLLDGAFLAAEPRNGKPGYNVTVFDGRDTYRVSVPEVPSGIAFGDSVTVQVKPTVYNGRLYFTGDIKRKE